jgi:GTPase SAR1 family protein
MARALSVNDLLNKKYKFFEFDEEWFDAFDCPERTGVWFVWGNSGTGKTTFVLQLIKYLATFGKVAYNSLEEGSAHTIRKSFENVGMVDVAKKVIIIPGESIDEIDERLSKPKSADVMVIDSIQYAGLTYDRYKRLKEKHRSKLIVLVSHADGKMPEGRSSKKIMYDATLKIWCEGYRAISKGRYIGPNGGTFTIWEDGSAKYWGKQEVGSEQ